MHEIDVSEQYPDIIGKTISKISFNGIVLKLKVNNKGEIYISNAVKYSSSPPIVPLLNYLMQAE